MSNRDQKWKRLGDKVVAAPEKLDKILDSCPELWKVICSSPLNGQKRTRSF
jgi:hypothetical protein